MEDCACTEDMGHQPLGGPMPKREEQRLRAAKTGPFDLNRQDQIMAIFEELISDRGVNTNFPQKLSSALQTLNHEENGPNHGAGTRMWNCRQTKL